MILDDNTYQLFIYAVEEEDAEILACNELARLDAIDGDVRLAGQPVQVDVDTWRVDYTTLTQLCK